MNKIIPISFGAIGVGGTAIGGAILFRNTKPSIGEKYKHAVLKLNADETIWNSKYSILKAEKDNPTSSTLSVALAKSKEGGKETDAKNLLKQGCEEIYKSTEEEKYLKDFKKFCSKTNKDVSTKTNWITGDEKGTTWDSSLTNLKSYDKALNEKLNALKQKLPQGSSPFSEALRKELKTWCENTKEDLFDGTIGSTKLINQDTFCVSN